MCTMNRQTIQYEELATRESNGIHVQLLWNRADDDLKVAVYDASTDSAFELAVLDASPLDVFDHPFAYAAFRGVDFGASLPEPIAA
jgi:hypothetical protein